MKKFVSICLVVLNNINFYCKHYQFFVFVKIISTIMLLAWYLIGVYADLS